MPHRALACLSPWLSMRALCQGHRIRQEPKVWEYLVGWIAPLAYLARNSLTSA